MYKVGQKIYAKKVGLWGVVLGFSGVKFYDKFEFNDAENGLLARMENGDTAWLFLGDVEEFIEPKYKIGQKVYCYPSSYKDDPNMRDTAEIVKMSLNKQKKEYSYLAFQDDGGYPMAFMEGSIVLVPKKPNVCEMTLADVCKKLGRNIKIIK